MDSGSPRSTSVLQQTKKHNLSRAAISLNSMRFDTKLHPLHKRPGSSINVSDRCNRLQSKINDIQVSAARFRLIHTDFPGNALLI